MCGETAQQAPSGPWGNQTHAWAGRWKEINGKQPGLLESPNNCLRALNLFFATGHMGKGSDCPPLPR